MKIAARGREDEAGEDAGDVEDDGVFVSRPRPMAAPMASHQRGFSDLSRRMVKYAISTHQRKSKEVY